MFQRDGGHEFDNSPMLSLFAKHGIYFHKSCPDTEQQNGVAKRKHRHILEMTRSFLFAASMPAYFWLEAVSTVVCIINRLPTKVLHNKTPFEILF